MARVTGLEPATSGVTGRRSNQLSYTRLIQREARLLSDPLLTLSTTRFCIGREELSRNCGWLRLVKRTVFEQEARDIGLARRPHHGLQDNQQRHREQRPRRSPHP